jgi:hypothetical protein
MIHDHRVLNGNAVSQKLSAFLHSVIFVRAAKDSKSDDLLSLFRYMTVNETWKSAPRIPVLVRYAPLYAKLFAVAPNGLVLASNLTAAILAVHKVGLADLERRPTTETPVPSTKKTCHLVRFDSFVLLFWFQGQPWQANSGLVV